MATPPHTTRARAPRRHWLHILTVAVISLAGLYAWYVNGQFDRLNQLNQRELAKASAELKVAVENAGETIRRFSWRPNGDPSGGPRLPWCQLAEFDKQQPYLSTESASRCDPNTSSGSERKGRDGSLNEGAGGSSEAKGAVGSSESDRHFDEVEFTAEPHFGFVATLRPHKANPATTGTKSTATFTFATAAVLEGMSFPDAFSFIFIADEKGVVRYQDAPAKRNWLRHLRWGDRRLRDAGANAYGTLQFTNLESVLGSAAPGWSSLRALSSRTRLRIGGEWHELYLEPLVLKNGKTTNLVVGGAVPTSTVGRQALAVGDYFTAGLTFLLLVAVLGTPFFKLLSLGRSETFSRRDVLWLYLSTAVLLALFTFAAQGVDGYVRWNETADKGLRALSNTLQAGLVDELEAIRAQLKRYDSAVSARAKSAGKAKAASVGSATAANVIQEWEVVTKWLEPRPRSKPESEADDILQLHDAGLHLDALSWIDPKGAQIWRVTSKATGGLNQVSQRAYFQAVRSGYLYQNEQGELFYFGPDRSLSDGQFYTFVSIPSGLRDGARTSDSASSATTTGGSEYVAVASARLLTLDRVALPSGYGFAVINREGRVLYHSDHRISLRQNLFEELDHSTRAKSIVYAGLEQGLTSRYAERSHELHFRPLPLTLMDGAPSACTSSPSAIHPSNGRWSPGSSCLPCSGRWHPSSC